MAKVDELSKKFDRFASDPIVIAKAIARAVRARRSPARIVAPRSTSFILWMSALMPTRMWDWSMRKMGYLSAKALAVTPAATPTATPTAKPTPALHAN